VSTPKENCTIGFRIALKLELKFKMLFMLTFKRLGRIRFKCNSKLFFSSSLLSGFQKKYIPASSQVCIQKRKENKFYSFKGKKCFAQRWNFSGLSSSFVTGSKQNVWSGNRRTHSLLRKRRMPDFIYPSTEIRNITKPDNSTRSRWG